MMPENYSTEVFPRLKPPPEMQIGYEIRPSLTAKDISMLCRGGMKRVQPGIESFSTETLKLIRKGTTAFRNLQFMKDSTKYSFILDWNLLTFVPGEKEDVYEKYLRDIPSLYHLPPPNAVIPVMFVKYSHYFENAKQYGLDLRPQDYYGLTFPFRPDDIRRMAHRFFDHNADYERMQYWLGKLNAAVSAWRARWLNSDGRTQSRLCFIQDAAEPTVYDSRSGDVVEHKLSPLTAEVLNHLERPNSKDDLVKHFGHVPDFDVEKEISFLLERRLLFEEDGRFMSLVAG
jgi:magnesium-protoporphyrin IX monomethyl ester (oxidative) cyclase